MCQSREHGLGRQVNLASETWKIGDKCTRRTEALVSIMICLWYRIDTSKIYIYIYIYERSTDCIVREGWLKNSEIQRGNLKSMYRPA